MHHSIRSKFKVIVFLLLLFFHYIGHLILSCKRKMLQRFSHFIYQTPTTKMCGRHIIKVHLNESTQIWYNLTYY
jgi:hypothetical protein